MENSPLCLTGTAEVPLGAVYMDQILSEEHLPIRLAGFGHCFRTEAGSGGRLPAASMWFSGPRAQLFLQRKEPQIRDTRLSHSLQDCL